MTYLGIRRSSTHGMRDFNIIAGFVCAVTGFRIFARNTFVRERDFAALFTGSQDTGHGIDFPFFKGHGVRDTGFIISHGTTG